MSAASSHERGRCGCGVTLPSAPYLAGRQQVCETCYARWIRNQGQGLAERQDETVQRKLVRQGVNCKDCGHRFKPAVMVGGLCETCRRGTEDDE